MSDQSASADAAARLTADLDELVDQLGALGDASSPGVQRSGAVPRLRPEGGDATLSQLAKQTVQRVKASAQEINNAISEADNGSPTDTQAHQALRAITAFGAIDADVARFASDAASIDPDSAADPASELNRLIGGLRSRVHTAAAGLWSWLIRRFHFQAFAVSGQLSGGVPPFGSGSVTLSLTFGPQDSK